MKKYVCIWFRTHTNRKVKKKQSLQNIYGELFIHVNAVTDTQTDANAHRKLKKIKSLGRNVCSRQRGLCDTHTDANAHRKVKKKLKYLGRNVWYTNWCERTPEREKNKVPRQKCLFTSTRPQCETDKSCVSGNKNFCQIHKLMRTHTGKWKKYSP